MKFRHTALLALSLSAQNIAFAATPSTEEPKPALELMAEISQPMGNLTFVPDGRKFFSLHPFYKPQTRVAELTSRTTFVPYPNAAWNTESKTSDNYLDDVLGLRGDENGVLWILDMGNRSKITPKIVGWDTKTNTLKKILYIPAPYSLRSSNFNDLVVDNKHGFIYIADEDIGPGGDGSKGALVTVDIKTGQCRRLLQGDVSTAAEKIPVVVNGKNLLVTNEDGSKRLLTIGNDGIAVDKDFEWLYFCPMNGHSLYRLKIVDLINDKLGDSQLSKLVEKYSAKENNGGIALDNEGNIYSTEPEHQAVGIVHAGNKKYEKFVSGNGLTWPDGISFSPDGFMYVPDSQIDKSPLCNDGKSLNKPPYKLFRFKPLAPGRTGS